MTPTHVDKQELKDWIDELEDRSILKSIQSLKISHESKKDFSDDLSPDAKHAIAEAAREADDSKSISHEQVMEAVVKHYSR